MCDANAVENMKDAGCDDGLIERCREIKASLPEFGPALIRLLTPRRKALHADRAKLDCLECLLFQFR